MRETVLSVEGLCKTYQAGTHQVHALRNVSFNLLQGEMLAITGTSGSGKSALLHILGAMDTPDQGRIRLLGRDITVEAEPKATDYHDTIGFIFQSYYLRKDLTVEDNIALPLIMKELDCQYILSEVNHLIELLGLERWRKHRPNELASAQQQRVALGRALICKPAIIVADEPTGNLDAKATGDIIALLHRIKREKSLSILIMTHDKYVASRADRGLLFYDGVVTDEWSRSAELNNELRKSKRILEGVS